GDDDQRALRAQLLHEHVGARRVLLDEQDAPPAQQRGVLGLALALVEQREPRARALVELVAKRAGLAARDQRAQALDELLDRLRDGPARAQHDLRRGAVAGAARDREDPGAELLR